MAFSTPYTFTALELLTAAKMNAIQANISAIWVGTTAGDTDYYTSSTAKNRVGIGTAFQNYRVNSGATAPEWYTPMMTTIAYRSATQSVSSDVAAGENTAIQFNDTDIIDDGSWHDTSTNNTRITCNITGLYVAAALVVWAGNTSGARYSVVNKNISTPLMYARQDSAGLSSPVTSDTQSFTGVPFLLANGDYIELYCGQNTGSALNILGAKLSLTLLRRTS